MTMRSTSGSSVSVCQTVTGAWPEILVRAAIMSRSRLRPGSWTTADFIWCFKPCLGLGVFTHFEAVFDTVEAFFAARVFRTGLASTVCIGLIFLQVFVHRFLRPAGHGLTAQPSGESDCVVLDYRVGQQLVAHGLEVGFGLAAVGGLDFEVEDFAL